jgi:glycosyltransferase involved in cell wall biosynthesis
MKNLELTDKTQFDHFPSVTVAMATYNGGKYLREQLDSILLQTLRPAEIVVCDDASTDNTIDILEEYQQRGLLKCFLSNKTLGYIENFKRAVSLCSEGHYIAIADQDDIWLPEKIHSAMKLIVEIEESNKPAMVYSDLIFINEDRKIINESFRNEISQDTYDYCLETLLFGGFVNGCTMLMNPKMASYFSTIPDSRFATHDTWIALIAYTFGTVGVVSTPTILYRRHQQNATELIKFSRRGRWKRLIREVLDIFEGSTLFEKELSVVNLFYRRFHKEFTEGQSRIIGNFLNLQGKGYIYKKIAFRISFRGKWR